MCCLVAVDLDDRVRVVELQVDVEEDEQVAKFSLQTVGDTLVQADGEIIKLDADSNVRIMIEKCVLESVV